MKRRKRIFFSGAIIAIGILSLNLWWHNQMNLPDTENPIIPNHECSVNENLTDTVKIEKREIPLIDTSSGFSTISSIGVKI